MQRLRKPLFAMIASLVLGFSCSCKHPPAAGHRDGKAASVSNSGATSGDSGSGGVQVMSGGGKPGSFALKDRSTKFDVTYTPETVQISKESVADSLRSLSDDGTTYTFDTSSSDAKKLKVGSVMLLSGIALRKVTAVSETPQGIVVQTDTAALTDAISDGTIEATVPVDFGAMQTSEAVPSHLPSHRWSLLPAVYASGNGGSVTTTPPSMGPKKLTFQMDPFVYSISFTPAAGQMNIDMTVTDTTSNLGFTATGYLKNFESLMNMVISGGKVTKYTFQNSGIEGDITVSWSAASVVAGPMNKIGSWTDNLKSHPALKGLAFYIPFYVGAIPFTMKFTGGITFVPAFTSKNTVLDGKLHTHYSGSAGFTVDHGNTSANGSITAPTQSNPTTNVLSLGPLGFTVAVEFPRVELGLGINLWNVGASTGFGLGSFSPTAYVNNVTAFGIVYGGPAAMLPCETHILDVSVNTGVSAASTVLSFFGSATKLTIEKQIYKKHYTGPKPGMMLCPS